MSKYRIIYKPLVNKFNELEEFKRISQMIQMNYWGLICASEILMQRYESMDSVRYGTEIGELRVKTHYYYQQCFNMEAEYEKRSNELNEYIRKASSIPPF